jgi:hypothetical protein
VAAVYTPKDFDITRIMHDIVALVGASANGGETGANGGAPANGGASISGGASANGSA